MIGVSDVIHGWLGWCPQAGAFPYNPHSREAPTGTLSPQPAGGVPASGKWYGRYRNRIILWAIFYTLAFLPFTPGFQASDLTREMQYFGIIAGVGLFAFFGQRFRENFDRLAGGEGILPVRGGLVIPVLVAGLILSSAALLFLSALAIVPLPVALALPAFATGFAFIPWYVLALVFLWERRTGCILVVDGKDGSLAVTRGA